MKPSTDNSRKHFDELLPFYVTGRISQTDREWAEQYLATHPEAWAELDWHRDLMREVVGKAEARAMQAPEMVGWAGIESQLRAARQAKPVTFGARLSAWLGALAARPLAPVAALVILVQGAVIGTLMHREPADDMQPTRSASAAVARDVLQVRFKQATAERDLRALLYGAGARIVDGPDQLGDYVLEPRRGALAVLQAELERSELVQSVTLLKAWKAEPREE
jgi:anti-sigma factor RsiW